jgi:hypothetical protein
MLKLGRQTQIKAKGSEHPVRVCDVLGIAGRHRLFLSEAVDVLVPLREQILVSYAIVEGAHLSGDVLRGRIIKLSTRSAEVKLESRVPAFANIKMHIFDAKGGELPGAAYAKVLEASAGVDAATALSFTSLSPEIEQFFRGLLGHGSQVDNAAASAAPTVSDTVSPKPLDEAAPAPVEGDLASAAHAMAAPAAVADESTAAVASSIAADMPHAVEKAAEKKKPSWLRSLHRS